MTNAPVGSMEMLGVMNNAKNAAVQQVASKQSSSSNPDFGKIMSQAQEQVQQTPKEYADQHTTKQSHQKSENSKAVEKETTPSNVTDENTDVAEEAKLTNTEKTDNVEMDEQMAKEECESLDEETLEVIEEKLEILLEEIANALGMTAEEVLQTMEQLGLQPVELLEADNMAMLVAAAMGEDATISLVMSEQMYGKLQELIQLVEHQFAALAEDTGLESQELEMVLEQVKQLEAEAMAGEEGLFNPEMLVTQEEMQSSTDNVVPFRNQQSMTNASGTQVEGGQQIETTIEVHQAQDDKSAMQNGESQEGYSQNQMSNFAENMTDVETQATQTMSVNADGTPSTEHIMRQLVDFVKIQKGTELTEMELQLHPASLGSVRVQLSTKGGLVTAQFTAENETVKNAIESQVVQLKSTLEEQGVKIEAVEVSVASHQMEKNLEQGNRDRQETGEEEKTGSIKKIRRASINKNSLEDEEAVEELLEDDATKLAMEMMAINGGTMDLLA